jgi:DNA-binding CsgD family transcriptional regulator
VQGRSAVQRTPTAGLLERETELEAIAGVLADASAGAGRVLLLEGEPGIGKSALLQAAAERALAGGLGVFRARAGELEREFAFGCVLQLFERRVRDGRGGGDADVLTGAAALAEPVFDPGRAFPAQGAELFPTLHGLFWLCSTLAEAGPIVVAVDDAHWADEPSLRFLAYLAQRVAELPVAVIVAARPAAPGATGDLLARLATHADTTVLRPSGLSREAARRIVEDVLGEPEEEFLAAAHAATGGNPLLLGELLRALDGEGAPPTEESAARVVAIAPAPVSRALAVALGRLPAAATTVARAAAVLGDRATTQRVAALAELPPVEVEAHTAALRAASILADRPEARFAHPVLRSAMLQELEAGERAAAHARVAALLARDGEPGEQVAAHLLEAPVVGEPWALAVLRAAAERASAAGLARHAADLLDRALREPMPESDRHGLLLARARAEASAGLPDAREHLEALAGSDVPLEVRVEALREGARLAHSQGRFPDAVTALTAALEAAPPDEALRRSLRAERAGSELWIPGAGVRAFADVAPFADPEDEPRTHEERVTLAHLAGAEVIRGERREAAIALARRAWGDGAFLDTTTAGDPALPGITAALTAGGMLDESRAVCDAALADSRRRGSLMGYATTSYLRAAVEVYEGRPQAAAADAEAAIDARRFGWSVYLPAAHWALATARLELGDVAGAREAITLDEEAEVAAESNSAFIALLLARAHVLLAEARHDEAVTAFLALGDLRRAMGTDNPGFLGWRPGAVEALLRAGRPDEARALADELVDRARVWGAPGTVGIALRTRALVDPVGTRTAGLEEAVAALRASPFRLELARTLVELGVALHAGRDREAARGTLREALDLADAVGGVAVTARARDELLAAGARPRRIRMTGPAALTPQELRVARLAANGLTNRQIAESLFVTLKAVKWHLGNAYGKLGIAGRSELPAALGDAGP